MTCIVINLILKLLLVPFRKRSLTCIAEFKLDKGSGF